MKSNYFFKSLLRGGIFVLICLFFSKQANAQLTINTAVSPSQLVSSLLGGGLNVTNISLSCPTGAYGTFANGNTTNIGVTAGILLTTGSATNAIGPNSSSSSGTCNGTSSSDPQLVALEPLATQDVCVLEFDMVPSCNNLQIRFVFGSEEYPEFVNGGFNDAFGFFISGPGPSCQPGFYNNTDVATLPSSSTIVSIDNINNGTANLGPCTNCAYYVNNVGGPTIQYDGFTTVLISNVAMCPCQSYHFKLAIADAGDCNYDSGVFVDFMQCSTALTATSTITPITSCSACDGTATANASGGNPPYTYSWSPSGGNAATATGLCPGTYTCTITDQGGCTPSQTVVAVIPPNGAVNATLAAQTNVNCSGGTNGAATVSASGGTGIYTYSWAPSGGTGASASGLAAGTYTVTITDSNGCSTTQQITITEPSVLTANATSTDVTCNGANSGTGAVWALGGVPGYTYSWAPSGGTGTSATGLGAGNYTVTVTDANGCSDSQSLTITQPTAMVVTTSSTAANCGGNNGTATATPTGGTPGYTYSWAPSGGTGSSATGLAGGNYTVTVTDANGCSTQEIINVGQTSALIASTSATSVSCFGGTTGSATVTPTSGNPPYTYSWSSGGTNATETNLPAGTYTVNISDNGGCTGTQTVTITQPTLLTASNSSQNISCFGGTNGSISVTPSGGTPNYTYSWMPTGGNNATANGLTSGSYTCTITDANGCTITQSATITAPTQLTAIFSFTNVSCSGGNNGTGTVIPSGGTPNYTYSWAPSGGNNATATGLSQGTYTCTITDANGCVNTQTISITQPPAVTSTNVHTNVGCNGGNNGTATVTPAGGTGTYTYSWSPAGGTGASATNLAAGTYTCTITDSNGCSTLQVITITQPQALSVSMTSDSLCPGTTGSVVASPGGGTGPYTYLWSNGATTSSQTLTLTTSQTFSVMITDANGCTTTGTAAINFASAPVSSFTSNANGGSFQLTLGTGQLCFTNTSTGASAWMWDLNGAASAVQSPCVTVTSADNGQYCASLVVANAFGCVDSSTVCIEIGESSYSIPNVFTPDGNGTNDAFVITNVGMKTLHCELYNRWGEKVYEWDGTTGYWDGKTMNGGEAVDGVYYYTAYFTDFIGKRYDVSGFVHLIRGGK